MPSGVSVGEGAIQWEDVGNVIFIVSVCAVFLKGTARFKMFKVVLLFWCSFVFIEINPFSWGCWINVKSKHWRFPLDNLRINWNVEYFFTQKQWVSGVDSSRPKY